MAVIRYLDFDDAVYINKRILNSPRVGLLSSGNLMFSLNHVKDVGNRTQDGAVLVGQGIVSADLHRRCADIRRRQQEDSLADCL